MISRLRMRRWKSHEDTQLQFGKGSNLFIGSMGSGKSSAIDAISFALFGTFPSLKSRRVKLEELVMQRPRRHSTAEIELEFDYGGKDYKVVRNAGAKTTSAQLFEAGKLVEAQTSRVTELIEGILRVDYDLFSRIIYAEQNRIDYLLALQKGERKRQIDELLGISRFEEVRANAGTAMNRLEMKISEIRSYLQGIGGEKLRAEHEEARTELGRMHEQLKHLQHTLSENHAKLRGMHYEMQALERAEQEHLRVEREIAGTESLLREKERELQEGGGAPEGGKYGKAKSEFADLERKLSESRRRLSSLTEEAAAAETELRLLRGDEGRLRKNIEEGDALRLKLEKLGSVDALESARVSLENKLQAAQAALAALETQRKQLSDSVAALHSAGAKCPVCDAALDEGRKLHLKEQRRKHISDLEDKIKSASLSLAGIRKDLLAAQKNSDGAKILASRLEAFAGSAAELGNTGKKIALLEAVAAEKGRGKRELGEAVKGLEAEMAGSGSLLQRMEKTLKLDGEIAALSGKMHALSGKLKSMEYKPAELSAKREELLGTEKEGAALGMEIASASNGIGERNKAKALLEGKLEELELKEGEMRQLQGKSVKLEQFQEAVVGTQAALREELVDAMNSAMNALWGSIYPYGDYVQLRLNATEEDYALELSTSENEWVALENCSGGERSCAALTLRIAFATVLTPGLSWLILDEPTHNLDAQAVQLLNRALHDEIPKIVEQTFIITHDEALKEGASAKIFYFERDKANSERSIVEELSG